MRNAANNSFEFASVDPAVTSFPFEEHQERAANVGTVTQIVDQLTESGDILFVERPGPSDPDTAVGRQRQPRLADDPFLDVDLLY